MEIHNLKGIDFDTLFAAFEMAFSDYDIHFEKEEVRSMLQRRGFDPLLSFAAFDQGSIVAFTFKYSSLSALTAAAFSSALFVFLCAKYRIYIFLYGNNCIGYC